MFVAVTWYSRAMLNRPNHKRYIYMLVALLFLLLAAGASIQLGSNVDLLSIGGVLVLFATAGYFAWKFRATGD